MYVRVGVYRVTMGGKEGCEEVERTILCIMLY